MNEINFVDGSKIVGEPGTETCIGVLANTVGHLMRRYNLTIEQLSKIESLKKLIN